MIDQSAQIAAYNEGFAAGRAKGVEESVRALQMQAMAMNVMKDHTENMGDGLGNAISSEWRAAMTHASLVIRSHIPTGDAEKDSSDEC